LLARWLPDRWRIFVGDGSFAVLELLHAVQQLPHAGLITRSCMDAELWHPKSSIGMAGRDGKLRSTRRPACGINPDSTR
jgi:hypothetical protein